MDLQNLQGIFIGLVFGGLFVIPSSIWVFYESGEKKISVDGKPYETNNGQWAWLFSCLLLWIISFPWYLYRRSIVLSPSRPIQEITGNTIEEQLRKYKRMVEDELITQEDYEKKKNELLKSEE